MRTMSRLRRLGLPMMVSGLCLAGCSGGVGTPAARAPNFVPAATSAFQSRVDAAASIVDAAPHVAGTYAGSYHEVSGGQTLDGTVVIGLTQSGSRISGSFDVTIDNRTADLTLSGTVKAAKHGARLVFTIINPHGRNAAAKAAVVGAALDGTAFVPPHGTMPSASITYKTTKSSE